MRDAIGGVFTLQAIVIFMIVVNCFLAFSVNYTKAFRVKNEIRSIIEKNEGLTCDALKQINDYMIETNYHVSDVYTNKCPSEGLEVAQLEAGKFCYKVEKVDISGTSDANSKYKGAYYTVVTFVNIDIPLFNRVFAEVGNIFEVRGETALIYSSGVNYSGLPTNCNYR